MTVYTDGACRGNPGPGGCAAIVENGDVQQELSRGYRWTTNNRMEIRSVILALETAPAGTAIRLVSDSQYVLNALSKAWIAGWKQRDWISSTKQPVKNRDLWEQLDLLVVQFPMTYQWVRGHAENPMNNRCDTLAVAAAVGGTFSIDAGYERIHPYLGKPTPAKPTPPVAWAALGQAALPGF